MHSPPLELVNEHYLCISGEVVVHPSAVIAAGVLLQADPGSQLIIAAGVCIGQGTVLHAYQGTLTLEAGAVLGNGVLIVGRGTIGANACIGSFTTILSCSIQANQIIPPNSLLGDTSRQISLNADTPHHRAAGPAAISASSIAPEPQPPSPEAVAHPPESAPESAPEAKLPDGAATNPEPPSTNALKQVYGQAYVERIMMTMFPHRRMLNAELNPTNPTDATSDVTSLSNPEDPPPSSSLT